MRKLAEVMRKQKACGSPKERRNFRGSPTEVPSSLLPSAKLPNYLAKLLRAKLTPGLIHAYILHDDWCAVFHGGPCDCDPEVEMRGEGDATH